MITLNEIVSSVKGEVNARHRDPILGTFILAWIACNWDKLATLIWGAKSADVRILDLASSMSPANILCDFSLLIFPMVISLIFLFAFPWISLWVKKRQLAAILTQHTYTVDLDVSKAIEQKKLRKAVLRADPEKEFLAEEVRLDLQKEKERNERRNKIKEYIALKAEAAHAEADAKKSKAESERLTLERSKRQSEAEAMRFEQQSALQKEALASSRFPAIYQLMYELAQSLQTDSITFSLRGLSNTISALFGYNSVEEMINDAEFNKDGLNKIKYLYFDLPSLVEEFENIALGETQINEEASGEILFDHIQNILESYDFRLISGEALAEDITMRVSEDRFDLLNGDELSGPMAETDTVFDEIELELVDYSFSTSFSAQLSGSASGDHRKEAGIPGQSLDVSVEAVCVPKLGKFGLSDYKLEISGSVRY